MEYEILNYPLFTEECKQYFSFNWKSFLYNKYFALNWSSHTFQLIICGTIAHRNAFKVLINENYTAFEYLPITTNKAVVLEKKKK